MQTEVQAGLSKGFLLLSYNLMIQPWKVAVCMVEHIGKLDELRAEGASLPLWIL